MSDLKPCPFCGGKMDGYPDYTISFKRDRRKIHGIYYEVCTLHCNRCSCTIQQAGATREEAEKHAYNVWNRRMSFTQPETHEKRTEERTETHACDCVSGVAAIIAAIEAVDEWDGGYNMQRANMIRDAIKALPSEQPQRMNGKWIDVTKTGGAELWKCSECGELELEDSYFCPNCGADMRGEQNGENS